MRNKFKLALTLLLTVFVMGVSIPKTDAYTVEQNRIQKSYTGTNTKQFVFLHESGNPNNVGANSLINEVTFMKRNWYNANAHYFVGSGGRVIQLLDDNDLGYHAGSWANARGIGIELARTNNRATFEKDYKAYVELVRDLGKKYNIPLTLDDGSFSKGIKSHLWVTNNVWGDHTDPYGYLAQWGITSTQLRKDIKDGFPKGVVTKPKPSAPKPSVPTPTETTLKVGSKVTVKKAINYDNGRSFYANGTYDVIEVKGNRVVIGKAKVVTSAIHFDNLRYASTVKPKPAPKPQPKPTQPSTGWYAENATFTPYSGVNVRMGTSTSHTITGTIYNPTGIRYNAVRQANGYVWIRYESYGGTRYMAVRPIGGQAFGTFR